MNVWYLLEICYPLSKSMQIEIISYVVFINLNEKFVTLKITEPLDPASIAAALRVEHF